MVLRVHIPFGPSSNFGQYLIDSKCPIGKMIYQLNTNKKRIDSTESFQIELYMTNDC